MQDRAVKNTNGSKLKKKFGYRSTDKSEKVNKKKKQIHTDTDNIGPPKKYQHCLHFDYR